MRRLMSWGVLLVLSISMASPSAGQQWIEDRQPGAGYRVELPGTPTRKTESRLVGNQFVAMDITMLETGGKMFFVTSAEVAAAVDPQTALDGGRENMTSQAGRRLRSERRMEVGGAPARLWVVDHPGNDVMVILAVLRGRRMYQTGVLGPRGSDTAPDTQRFISSFALLPL